MRFIHMKRKTNVSEEPCHHPLLTFQPLVFLLCFLGSGILSAATIPVSSLPALQKAINKANAGDHIILADGSYTNSALISIT
jgi:poly(beta-D-mannuronate) lyase